MSDSYKNPESTRSARQRKQIGRSILAALFLVAGILHFVFPGRYAEIVPPLLPDPIALVLFSGVCEMLGGMGVLIPAVRRLAGYGLILLLIAVFPANIYMLLQQLHAHGWTLYTLVLVLRLPLQFLLIWWVDHATRSVEEPSEETSGS